MAIEKQNPQDSQGVLRVADEGPIPDDPASNYSMVLTRGGPDGAVDTITVTKDGISWRQTLTYTGSNVTAISAWVRL